MTRKENEIFYQRQEKLQAIMDSLNPKIPVEGEYNPLLSRNGTAPFNQEQLNFLLEKIRLGYKPTYVGKVYNTDGNKIKKRMEANDWISVRERRDNSLSQKELDEIKQAVENNIPYEIIIKKYNVSMVALKNRIINNKWTKTPRKQTYTFNENYFDEIDNEHKAYWLGFLAADGYILSKRNRPNKPKESQSFGFSINIKDFEMFKFFKRDLQANNPVHFYENKSHDAFKKNSKYGRILLTSQHTVDSLKKWGIIEHKTFSTKMPNIKEELIPAFIRGYSDGDGSLYVTKKEKFGWSLTGTKELLEDICKFLHKENLKLSQRWPERNNNNYTVTFYGRDQIPKLLDIIYKDATIYMLRKYDIYLDMKIWQSENKKG